MTQPNTVRLITGLGLAQLCSWGTLFYSFPLIAEAMGRELGWPRDQVYGAVTVGLLLSAVAVYPVGRLIDRGYGRTVMTGGSMLAGLFLIGWSQVHQLWLFYFMFAGVGCLQAATLYDASFAVIMQQLGAQPARRGITALTLFGGFASTVFVPLIQYLIESWGWRGALVGLGGINIVVCGGLYALTIRPRPLGIQVKTPATALAETRAAAATTWAMRQPVFWALAIALTAHAAMFAAFTFHFYPLLLEKGLSTQNVVAVIACIGPAQVSGRLVIWAIAPQASVPALGAALVGIFPLIFVAIALLPASIMGFMGVAIAFGAANGVMTIVKGLVVPSMLSSLAYGAINGMLTAPGTVARAMAPMAAALVWAASGGYDRVVVALLGSSIVLALSFWLAVASYTQKRGQLEPPLA